MKKSLVVLADSRAVGFGGRRAAATGSDTAAAGGAGGVGAERGVLAPSRPELSVRGVSRSLGTVGGVALTPSKNPALTLVLLRTL